MMKYIIRLSYQRTCFQKIMKTIITNLIKFMNWKLSYFSIYVLCQFNFHNTSAGNSAIEDWSIEHLSREFRVDWLEGKQPTTTNWQIKYDTYWIIDVVTNNNNANGSRHIGPRTIGPRTVGPRGPTVRGPICHFWGADSWAPDNWAPEIYHPKKQFIIKKTKKTSSKMQTGVFPNIKYVAQHTKYTS